jgi:hypothetical protein
MNAYTIGTAYPSGEKRYLIQCVDGRVVANDIEDRMYAALLCEAFNLLGRNADIVQATALLPTVIRDKKLTFVIEGDPEKASVTNVTDNAELLRESMEALQILIEMAESKKQNNSPQ